MYYPRKLKKTHERFVIHMSSMSAHIFAAFELAVLKLHVPL